MKKSIFIVIALFAVSLLVINGFKGQSTVDESSPDGIKWSPATITQEEIAASGKPIYLFVTTDWCTFCKKMKAQTFSDSKVRKLLDELFVAVAVNPEKPGTAAFTGEELSYADLAKKLGVTGYPASYFFDSKGELIGGQPGYIDAETFADLAEYVGDGHYTDYTFARFRQLPADQRR